MVRWFTAVIAAGLVLGAHTAAAQPQPDPAKAPAVNEQKPATTNEGPGSKNAHAMCIGCHGIPGYKTAFPLVYHVPMIAGQQPAYIVNALKAYKSGERAHPSMRAIAGSLTEKDMADLAAYYGAPAK